MCKRFNYRRLPAVALMQQMISEGEIGTPLPWRSTWLSDEFRNVNPPFDWRFDQQMGASTIADLGSHLVHLAEWIIGPISDVCDQSRAFTPTQVEACEEGQSLIEVD